MKPDLSATPPRLTGVGQPTIPAGSTITAATMKLTMVSGTSLAYTANAYQVTGGEWDPTTIQWTNKPAANILLASNISNNNRTKYQFSVLTAVRHWYDGDPTGQNQNYGIMLRYYDESLTGYYNSVYSGDVVDTNSRPKLTISYTPPDSEISVLEGYTMQLPLPDTTETITWTSSNTTVATINSAGKVTGVKAGKVTITASAGGAELQTYTVYVRIENGIYRIDCNGIHSYLSANSGPLENATTVLRMVSEEGLPMLRQQWRVTYLSAGYYVIRPLHNQNMALHARNGVSDVTTIGYNDTLSGVPAENRWTIEYLNGGYAFKCQGDNSQSLRCSTTHPGSSVYTGAYSSMIYWVFESVSSVSTQFYILDRGTGEISTDVTRYVAAGETATLSDLEIAAAFVTSDAVPSISWESYAPSKASVNSQTGAVTGIVEGEAVTITARCTFRGVSYTKSYTVYVAEEDVPVMRIRHYYDLGYEVREGDASAAIQSYQNTVSARFEEIFGITLFYSIYEYTSICDECVLD